MQTYGEEYLESSYAAVPVAWTATNGRLQKADEEWYYLCPEKSPTKNFS
jgi:hypothetical protein